jgi:hypothetical protein
MDLCEHIRAQPSPVASERWQPSGVRTKRGSGAPNECTTIRLDSSVGGAHSKRLGASSLTGYHPNSDRNFTRGGPRNAMSQV